MHYGLENGAGAWLNAPQDPAQESSPYLWQVCSSRWEVQDEKLFLFVVPSWSPVSVFTAHSGSPLDRAKPGLEWVSRMPHDGANFRIPWLANGMGSHIISFGIPTLENTDFIFLMTVRDDFTLRSSPLSTGKTDHLFGSCSLPTWAMEPQECRVRSATQAQTSGF